MKCETFVWNHLRPSLRGCPQKLQTMMSTKTVQMKLNLKTIAPFFIHHFHVLLAEVETYVVILRVVKMGESAVSYRTEFSNSLSTEFQEIADAARKGVRT